MFPHGMLRDNLFVNRDCPVATDTFALVVERRLAARRRLLASRAAAEC